MFRKTTVDIFTQVLRKGSNEKIKIFESIGVVFILLIDQSRSLSTYQFGSTGMMLYHSFSSLLWFIPMIIHNWWFEVSFGKIWVFEVFFNVWGRYGNQLIKTDCQVLSRNEVTLDTNSCDFHTSCSTKFPPCCYSFELCLFRMKCSNGEMSKYLSFFHRE